MGRLPGQPWIFGSDGVEWSVDEAFLTSGWRCVWGEGCKGIEDEPNEADQFGCCSVGAEMIDRDEALLIGALGSSLDPSRFEQHRLAAEIGVLDESGMHTRVVADRCIFHNSVGFRGGAGCALHVTALVDGENPIDHKPSVCWQLPLKVDKGVDDTGAPTRHVRPWRRSDWGPGGETMSWCCSDAEEAPEAFDAATPAFESLAEELRALMGDSAYDSLAAHLHTD